ncbi:ankyrin [Hyaloscypha variabilis F]|uniref:Ankyrin n=1 Tax=Hyaloscypha variabilis (strain UAMH 11265 / GT02V1 / F) TaxID=1149755 RepID=A0A2J6QZE4_HYAVF|nr:ankyrin [Hyaloscypha variabilis F]
MNREQFKANIQPWDHDLAPGEILPSLLQFVHKPYETLSVLEQNKYFPPPKNNSHGFGSGNILETSGEIEQPTNEARHKMLENIAEQNFEKGVCSLMGLGMFKDIIVGVQLIQSSAEQGCTRARAIGSSIENWLREASLHGSRLALEELRSRFPDTHREVVAINRFVFDLNCPDVFNYTKHILPHFDLGNVSRLESQIKSFKLERETETGTTSSISTLAAMEIRNKNFPRSCYVFGSLLHLACLFGFLDAAALLIGYCFDIDAQNTHPALRTPLLCALSRGQSAIAKLLISKGASCVPLLLWSEEKILCSTPSPLHYLVNVESDSEAKELARLLVKGGADVNCKCEVGYLMSQNPTEIPVLKGRSVTPLRWAIIHQKAQLVKALLNLGAKFAFETYLRHPTEDKEDSDTEKRGYILLETPCTDLDILAMFFARARVPGLPIEFSQTPLGLLVSEDDGPERRLRPGFESFDKIRDALDLLLELQPGHEDILLWSAVRHDHVEIVQYLLEHRRFPIESRWRGLTMLHTAVLYGRVDLVRYLLHQGADAVAVTEKRHLTCLHLLMLVPRDRKTDQEILDCILYCGIEVDTRESCDDLTALHLAVRNRKICCVKTLLDIGADPSIPVKDQLSIIAQGKSGLLSHIPSPSQIFTPNLTILGEVIIQYLQDKFYSYDYVADLLFLFLDHKRQPLTSADLVIDSGNGITILHLLALITHPSEESPIPKTKYNPPPSPPQPDTALISLLQLVLLRCAPSSVNVFDSQNDTPLHFACAAHNLSNIQALLSFGGEPTLINSLGLNPLDILLWSTFFIKGKTLTFWSAEKSWHPKIDYGIRNDSVVKHSHDAPTVLSSAINIFQDLGWNIDERLRRLALAWDYATNEENLIIFSLLRQRNDREHVELVPEGSAKGIQVGEEGERDPDRVKEYGTSGIRRNYWVATVRGAVRNKAVREGEVMFGYEDNDEVEGK